MVGNNFVHDYQTRIMKLKLLLVINFLCICLFAYAQQKENIEKSSTSEWWQYGALGGMVAAMFWYIVNRDKAHAKERAETNQIIKDQFARSNQLADEAAKKTEAHTNILTELKTLIQVDIQTKQKNPG